MKPYFGLNGLMFWTEKECQLREMFRDYFVNSMRDALLQTNPAWQFMMVEAPVLMPRLLVNANYTENDVYLTEDLVLRPETTPGTYAFIRYMFDDTNSGMKPPVCVWQYGKSFRQEQDQPSKHMRLKEFYQLEFQCVFTADTKNDYHTALLKPVENMIKDMVGLKTRIVESDRLPDYSSKTMDVECVSYIACPDNGQGGIMAVEEKMELASISLRKDFPGTFKFNKSEKDLLVAEVAIGLDRCVYNFMQRNK